MKRLLTCLWALACAGCLCLFLATTVGCHFDGTGHKTTIKIGSPFIIEIEEHTERNQDGSNEYKADFTDWIKKMVDNFKPAPTPEVEGPPAPEVFPGKVVYPPDTVPVKPQ
jgi:hypothetical protein